MNEKVSFNDLKKKDNSPLKFIKINDKEIEVKQYLPVNEKLNLVSRVLSQVTQNEYPFVNSIQLDVYSTLEIIFAYSPDIEFSDKEKENPADLYDMLEESGISNKIIAAIPKVEYEFVMNGIEEQVMAFYAYRNSVKGILEDITADYSNLSLDATEIQQKLTDSNNLGLLKDIMEKLG